MSPHTLWVIILKIFGIYFFLQLFYPLSQIISFLFFIGERHDSYGLLELSATLFSAGIYLILVAALIFRTNWFIDKLRLDKGFSEEKLEINIHRSTVLKIAVIFSGIILFADSLPSLLKELFAYYQDINLYSGFKRYPKGGEIIFQLAKVLISFFMMTSSRLIVNFIERKRKDKVKVAE